jgi:hypothetical protein
VPAASVHSKTRRVGARPPPEQQAEDAAGADHAAQRLRELLLKGTGVDLRRGLIGK